jgi:hypothetical protein
MSNGATPTGTVPIFLKTGLYHAARIPDPETIYMTGYSISTTFAAANDMVAGWDPVPH